MFDHPPAHAVVVDDQNGVRLGLHDRRCYHDLTRGAQRTRTFPLDFARARIGSHATLVPPRAFPRRRNWF
jgi:hypothetical protein